MKRIFILLLAMLLLTGCAAQTTTPDSTDDAVQQTGWPTAKSPAEGISAFKAPEEIRLLGSLGDQIVAVMGGKITIVSGENCVETATTELASSDFTCQFLPEAIACYPVEGQLILLDQKLQVTGKYPLPEELEGDSFLSPDGAHLYYCVGPEIRVYDTTVQIDRKLKFTTCQEQKLTGIYLDGKLLSCDVTYDDGESVTMFLATEDGSVTHTDTAISQMASFGEEFFLERFDGTVRQLAFGAGDAPYRNFEIPEDAVAYPTAGGIVAVNTEANYYEFASGNRVSAVTLPEFDHSPVFAGNAIWLAKGNTLYRWSLLSTETGDNTNYKTTLYTASAPDTEALAALQAEASALAEGYGIQILLATDAVAVTGDLDVVQEYQAAPIQAALVNLQKALESYPSALMQDLAKEKLLLAIVRSVDGTQEAAQLWDGATPYILLPAGGDMDAALANGLAPVINSRILTLSNKVDKWVFLNPKKFDYGDEVDEKYLSGEDRAFVDQASTKSSSEDRIRIFQEAMKADNAETFAPEAMQKKLKMLCEGIRDTWGWKKSAETYPWEQYLTESLAYVK